MKEKFHKAAEAFYVGRKSILGCSDDSLVRKFASAWLKERGFVVPTILSFRYQEEVEEVADAMAILYGVPYSILSGYHFIPDNLLPDDIIEKARSVLNRYGIKMVSDELPF